MQNKYIKKYTGPHEDSKKPDKINRLHNNYEAANIVLQ